MNILITGAKGYIGRAVATRLASGGHKITLLNVRNDEWVSHSFCSYDAIVHCAALVHKNEKKIPLQDYFKINVELTERLAEKAKQEGVSKFIFMSTRGVYGQENSCYHEVVVDEHTPLRPRSKYAISKLEAERRLSRFQDESFKVAIIRAPFIYGPGCKGNYQNLRKVSLALPVLFNIQNEYSMLYVDNLCELITQIIEKDLDGYFMPQDEPVHSTYEMMREIKKCNGQKVYSTRLFNPLIRFASLFLRPARNAFGNAIYDHNYAYCGCDYHKVDFVSSLRKTEDFNSL